MSRRSPAEGLVAVPVAVWACVAAAAGCWVEPIHIEPDGWEADREDGGDEEAAEADEVDGGEGSTVCGDGVLDPSEECETGATAACGTTCGSVGVRGCGTDCRWLAECAVPAESCNGADDDCDGASDEDFECRAGATRPCTDGPCSGSQTCAADRCVWDPCDLGPPAVNDDCAGAIDIGVGGAFDGDTCGASDDHAPAAVCGGPGGRDLWYRFELTQREVVYLDTVDGHGWDTVLQIRWGSCPGAGSAVVCSDNACPADSGGRRSQIVEALDPGMYFVVVDGRDAAESGPFTLLFQHAGCGEAGVIPGSGNYDGSTSGRTDAFASSCGGAALPDVIYYFGLCGPRRVTATTCNAVSGFDSVLSFASGGCGPSFEVACNDDDPTCGLGMGRSTVSADLPQGLNFLIVDGRRGAPGAYRVTVSGI